MKLDIVTHDSLRSYVKTAIENELKPYEEIIEIINKIREENLLLQERIKVLEIEHYKILNS